MSEMQPAARSFGELMRRSSISNWCSTGFLSGEQGLKKVEMSINGRPLSAFDPFNSKHSKTIREPSDPELIRLGNHDIWLQAFTSLTIAA